MFGSLTAGLGPLGDGQPRARLGVVRLDVDAQDVLQEVDALRRRVRRAGEAVAATERRVRVALATRGQGEREPAEVVAQAVPFSASPDMTPGCQWPIELHRRTAVGQERRGARVALLRGGLEEAVLERRRGEECLQVLARLLEARVAEVSSTPRPRPSCRARRRAARSCTSSAPPATCPPRRRRWARCPPPGACATAASRSSWRIGGALDARPARTARGCTRTPPRPC